MVVRIRLDGIWYILNPSGWMRPDYSVPGTAEKVKRSVDEAYDANWSADRWNK